MAWMWTDELGERLIAHGIAPDVVEGLMTTPEGFSMPDGADPVLRAIELFDLEPVTDRPVVATPCPCGLRLVDSR